MKLYVTWTDHNYRKIRENTVDYPGTRDKLAKQLGEELLSEMKSRPDMTGKNLLMMLSSKAAIIYCKPGRVEGTVSIKQTAGETNATILNWLLNR